MTCRNKIDVTTLPQQDGQKNEYRYWSIVHNILKFPPKNTFWKERDIALFRGQVVFVFVSFTLLFGSDHTNSLLFLHCVMVCTYNQKKKNKNDEAEKFAINISHFESLQR